MPERTENGNSMGYSKEWAISQQRTCRSQYESENSVQKEEEQQEQGVRRSGSIPTTYAETEGDNESQLRPNSPEAKEEYAPSSPLIPT